MTRTWLADLIPISISFDDQPDGRPAVLMVVDSKGEVLAADAVVKPPSEYADIAALLRGGIDRVVAVRGERPRTVRVRHREIADAWGVHVTGSPPLVGDARQFSPLNEAFESLAKALTGQDTRSRASSPLLWGGWGWTDDEIREVFSAAASFYGHAPWRLIADDEIITATLGDGSTWFVSVLGNADETYGVGLYRDGEDLTRLFASPMNNPARPAGATLSLTFDVADELPPEMLREVRAERWPIASPSAFPILIAINTPGGGITRRDRTELCSVVDSVGRFVGAFGDALGYGASGQRQPDPVEWKDPKRDVTIAYRGSWALEAALFDRPARLASAMPTGDGARPGQVLPDEKHARKRMEGEDRQIVLDYWHWIEDRPRSSSAADAARDTDRHISVATDLVSGIHASEATLRGITEGDLRAFVYVFHPMRPRRGVTPARLCASLALFFEYLAAIGIECPWAEPILADPARVEARHKTCRAIKSDMDRFLWVEESRRDLEWRLLSPPLLEMEQSAESPGRPFSQPEWQAAREEIIGGGITSRAEVLARLIARFG